MINASTTTSKFTSKYFNYLIIIWCADSVFGLLGTFYDIRETVILFFLFLRLIIDIILCLSNLRFLRVNQIEVLLILLLVFNIFVGIYHNNEFSRRWITDLSNPLFFIFKVTIIRMYVEFSSLNLITFNNFIKNYANAFFIAGILQVVGFYILLLFTPMYLGLTPIIYPKLIFSLIEKNNALFFASFLIIILGGKRAMLIGGLLIITYYKSVIQKKAAIYAIALFVTTIVSFIAFDYFGEQIEQQESYSKYKVSYDVINSTDFSWSDMEMLDYVGGGRVGEVLSSTKALHNSFDWLFGIGAGFVYELESVAYGDRTQHSNAHFSPVSIITKYGLVFYIVFMVYVIYPLTISRKKWKKYSKLHIILLLFCIGALVDTFFAYTFFIETLLPLALGFLYAKIPPTSFQYLEWTNKKKMPMPNLEQNQVIG